MHDSRPASVPPVRDPALAVVPPPLLPLVGDSDWPSALVGLRDGFAGKLNVYRTMAHHPALLAAWAALRQHLIVDSALSAQAREIVTLRVGHVWGSRYEWAQHVVRGRETGLSDARIVGCRLDRPAEHDEGVVEHVHDRLLIAAVDALLGGARLSSELVDALTRVLGLAGLFDLMATVGMYTTLAFIVNSFEVAVEPEMTAALAARPLSTTGDEPGSSLSTPPDEPGSSLSTPPDEPGSSLSTPRDEPGSSLSTPRDEPGSSNFAAG